MTIGIFTNIIYIYISLYGKKLNCGPELLGWLRGKESTCNAGDTGSVPGGMEENPLEEEMATHSSSCLGNPMDRGTWWATVQEFLESELSN